MKTYDPFRSSVIVEWQDKDDKLLSKEVSGQVTVSGYVMHNHAKLLRPS